MPATANAARTRVVHNKREPFDVYIGRPSKWGNPFSHKDDTLAEFRVATREEAVAAYREWIKTQDTLLAALPELRGKVLGCWCKPLACHGDVLAELAESTRRCPICLNARELYAEDVCPHCGAERPAARPSEFDLKPTERKLPCGCYVEDGRITGQAFLCDKGHRLQDKVKS